MLQTARRLIGKKLGLQLFDFRSESFEYEEVMVDDRIDQRIGQITAAGPADASLAFFCP